MLAVIGLGSMALWQASRLSDSVTGFEAASPLWSELEAETGQNIRTRCGGLSIGTADGPYLSARWKPAASTEPSWPERFSSRQSAY